MADKVTIYSDGGSRGNPGPAAIGAVISVGGAGTKTTKAQTGLGLGTTVASGNAGAVHEISEKIGQATNNTAEYRAIVEALKKAKLVLGKKRAKLAQVECFLDSELVVKQLNGEYKIKEESLFGLFIELWNLRLDFGTVSFMHVRREKNRRADALVNQALDN